MVSSKFLFQKNALITGASSGIGELTAQKLASQGLRVTLVARREERLMKIVEEINLNGGKAKFIVADLTREEDRTNIYKKLVQENELPDILINNAGFGWYGYFSKMSWQVAKDLISLNIESVVHLTSLFLPNMLENEYGHIINIGSVAGKMPEQGIALYSSSKSFLDSFTTILYRELVGTQVNVSVVRAGPIKTEFFDAARALENGGNVPAEKLATPTSNVADKIWGLLKRPRKVVYVPFWMGLSPLVELLFSWIIDLVGPILLKSRKKR